jgi:hypothetical protein
MSGERNGAKDPSSSRNAGGEPPGFDRVAGAFRRSGCWLIGLGIAAALCGLALLGGSLLGIADGAATITFLSAGGLVAALSVVPFLLGWRRLRRVEFLTLLRARWVLLTRAGDPDDQVGTLRRAYAGLIGNDLRARTTSSP